MIVGLVLAAGKSTRFGADKRKSLLPNGQLVLAQSIQRARSKLDQIIVVLRATDHQFARELASQFNDPSISYFLAPDADKGMAHSLANAISNLTGNQRPVEGCVIFLGDMPYLNGATIEELLTVFKHHRSRDPIVVPIIQQTTATGATTQLPGHPVIFSAAYFTELIQLSGDSGAKRVITRHKAHVIRIEVNDHGILKDVDRPSDIEAN